MQDNIPQLKSKYKAGDRVRIVNDRGGHCFDIGEIITLVHSTHSQQPWRGNSLDISCNWLYEDNFVLVKAAKTTATKAVPDTDTSDTDTPQCTCSNCSSDCTDEHVTIDGEVYCYDCESELFAVCEYDRCGERVAIDEAIHTQNAYFCCRTCANNAGWYKCNDCSEWLYQDDAYNDNNGDTICQSCYDDNYTCCEGCSETIHNDDSYYNESTGYAYCDSCWQDEDDAIIKYYSYKPSTYLYAKMPWENTMYLGIELEVECGSKKAQEQAQKVLAWLEGKNVQDRVYIKEDSSLENGFEIVFMPATLQAIHKKFPMRDFLVYLKKIGLTSYEEGSCGLHVHLSKSKMTDRDLWAGKIFFYQCQSQILKFSGRASDRVNYCKFDQYMPKNGKQQENGRYSAFNSYGSANTCEIRVFRGTLAYDRFLASLQFSDLFGEYIQQVSVTFLKNKPKTVIWQDFIAYAGRKNKYSQLVKYVKKNNIV